MELYTLRRVLSKNGRNNRRQREFTVDARQELFPITEGTPQGGVISPLLANIALHGLETTIRDAFPHFNPPRTQKPNIRWKPQVIRYADDFVIIHPDLEALQRAKEIAEEWLADMGLELKPSKTRITHTLQAIDGEPGFDFLGFNIRQYPRGKNRCVRDGMGRLTGFTPSIRPSKKSQKRFLHKIREIVHHTRTIPPEGLISILNPIIRGWGHYYSAVVSKDVFHKMDHLIFWKLWAWARRRHPKKSCQWVLRKYWLRGNKGGYSRFGIEEGYELFKLSTIPIQRHVKVQDRRSPYDGDAVYWSTRAGKYPGLRLSISGLMKKQKGTCLRCGLFFKPGDQMQRVQVTDSVAGKPVMRWALVHEYCQS